MTHVPPRQQAARSRLGLKSRLFLAFFSVCLGTLVAVGVGLFSLDQVGRVMDGVIQDDVPTLTGALDAARTGERVIAAAPLLASAPAGAEREAAQRVLNVGMTAFQASLDRLAASLPGDARLVPLTAAAATLTANLDALVTATQQRLAAQQQREAKAADMTAALAGLGTILGTWSTQARESEEEAREEIAMGVVNFEIIRRASRKLVAAAQLARPVTDAERQGLQLAQALLEAASAATPAQLEKLTPGIAKGIERLSVIIDTLPPQSELGPLLARLTAISTGPTSIAVLRAQELTAEAEVLRLLTENRAVSGGLTAAAETLVADRRQVMQGALATVQAAISGRTVGLIIVAIVSILLSLAIVWIYVGQTLVRRLLTLDRCIREIASGELDQPVPTEGGDEIGMMGRGIETLRLGAQERQRMQAEREADKGRAEADRRATLNALAQQFDTSVNQIVSTVSASATQMHTTAQSLMAMADHTSAEADMVSSQVGQASADVQNVASAAEELTASIAEIGRQLVRSTDVARMAAGEAHHTTQLMMALTESADRIGAVVSIISGIAAQTNLLALNATIEASRAGEAGRGFAVVAHEVKQLAMQTGKATTEISEQINALRTATDEATQAVDTIRDTIDGVNGVVATISSAMEQQGMATQEIARNIQSASSTIRDVAGRIEGVSQDARQTDHSANHVLTAAVALSREATALRGQVEGFIETVRAA